MLPRSLRCLCLCLVALVTILIDQSTCHQPFSRRGTLSFSTRHRFARRSSPRVNNRLQPRSTENPSLATSDEQAVSHQRRSIDLDQFDDNYPSQLIDQERDPAEKLWEEFIQSTDGEDVDSYPDFDDEDQSTSGSPSVSSSSKNSATAQPVTTSSTSTNEMSNPAKSSDQQDQIKTEAKQNGSNYHEDNKVKESPKKLDQPTKQAKEVDVDQQAKQVDSKNEQEAAEAKKQQEATEAKKEQEAAEAKKEQDAEAKNEQEAKAKKQQEDEAHKRQEAEAKEGEDAANKKANKGKEAYLVTDLQQIPGTSVTTGTAHRAKDETYNSSPSSEEHIGDATFFTPDVGACGHSNTPDDHIVAVSHILYDSFPSKDNNPNTNTICHRMIRATYNGKSVDVKVMDRCADCAKDALDFTESAFEKLAPKEQGRLHGMTWTFI